MSDRRGWRLDDWMRPNVRGRYPVPRQATPKLRRETALRLGLWLAGAASLAAFADGYWGRTAPFLCLIMAAPDLVLLCRSRQIGWRDREPDHRVAR